MKKHAIIPIFIPHEGCPNDCVFCNQKIITARSQPVTADHVEDIIKTHLSTLIDRKLETIEIAFFGGSFTGIPMTQQNEYLEIAYKYKKAGLVDKLHMSTRPDYINRDILENLKRFQVDVIELGVQSFDEEVLRLSKRGHTIEQVYDACQLIKDYGFTLGIQLMIGLPGDTMEKSIKSAEKASALKPALARLYPTVVLEDTELADMYRNGTYKGLREDEAVNTCAAMYKILTAADVNVMRVGLKSTDLVTNQSDLGGNYHPAFRQLVEGKIAREIIENELLKTHQNEVIFASNSKSFSNMIGHKGINKKYFKEKYPDIKISYIVDNDLKIGIYQKK